MKMRVLLVATLSLFVTTAASAAFVDSITGLTPSNYDGLDQTFGGTGNWGSSLIGQSFNASAPTFNRLTLTMSAADPADGGSFMVYLVADDGTGGGYGIAGTPTYTPGGAAFTALTKYALIAQVPDSALSLSPTNLTLPISSAAAQLVAGLTQNDEYWIVIDLEDPTAGPSSAHWWYYDNSTLSSIPTTMVNQAVWNNSQLDLGTSYNYGPSIPVDLGVYSGYMMIVTPEPVSIAVLGVGLFGIGYVRRRSSERRNAGLPMTISPDVLNAG